jgi:peroxiredoxin
MPEVGERAPDFTLQSTRGEINLQRFCSGKMLVLAFYIEDRTPG